MKTLRRILTATAFIALGTSLASASTIITLSQAATGGTLPSLGSGNTPPPPSTGTASVSQFNQAAADASIVCPSGFNCSTASLYEIDLGITASLSGSLNVVNASGTNQNIDCITSIPVCTGPSATSTSGVSLQGIAGLSIQDPNSAEVGPGNLVTFSVATTNVTGSGSGRFNFTTFANGTTPESGSNSVNNAPSLLFSILNDGSVNFATESAPYIGGGNVLFNLALSNSVLPGTEHGGIGTTNNNALLNSGAITVNYLYSYTESATNEVPEPATMALLGGALVGLGILGKRLKKT